MLVKDVSEPKRKPEGSTEATSTHQADDVSPPAKTYDAAGWDEPLNPFPHDEQHALQRNASQSLA